MKAGDKPIYTEEIKLFSFVEICFLRGDLLPRPILILNANRGIIC